MQILMCVYACYKFYITGKINLTGSFNGCTMSNHKNTLSLSSGDKGSNAMIVEPSEVSHDHYLCKNVISSAIVSWPQTCIHMNQRIY